MGLFADFESGITQNMFNSFQDGSIVPMPTASLPPMQFRPESGQGVEAAIAQLAAGQVPSMIPGQGVSPGSYTEFSMPEGDLDAWYAEQGIF